MNIALKRVSWAPIIKYKWVYVKEKNSMLNMETNEEYSYLAQYRQAKTFPFPLSDIFGENCSRKWHFLSICNIPLSWRSSLVHKFVSLHSLPIWKQNHQLCSKSIHVKVRCCHCIHISHTVLHEKLRISLLTNTLVFFC